MLAATLLGGLGLVAAWLWANLRASDDEET